jgi:hypothetical protein
LLAISFAASAFAQPAEVQISASGVIFADDINGLDGKVGLGFTYDFLVEARTTAGTQNGATLGFVIYSPDGANGNLVHDIAMGADWGGTTYWDLPSGILTLDVDGTLPEQILTGGATIAKGFNSAVYVPVLTFQIDMIDSGVVCIDSMFFPPAGEWVMTPGGPCEWYAGGGDGAVGGSSPTALCYSMWTIPDLVPECNNPDAAAAGSHCDPIIVDMSATDPDGPDPITYGVVHDGAGSASVDANGTMTYLPDPSDGTVNVTVTATEIDQASAECYATLTVTNIAPVATCPPDLAVAKGKSATSPGASVADADACDSHVWSFVSVNPAPLGTIDVDGATGAVTFNAEVDDAVGGADTDYEICLEVTDGIDVDTCCFTFTVLNTEPFCIAIGEVEDQLQGHHAEVCITFEAGSNTVGGFDFLIDYDNSVMSFVGATEGSVYGVDGYEWEYFTYRYGPNGNCSGGCPSGKLRVVGIAETNDGAHHPTSVQVLPGDTFACLDFLISNDRTYECQFAPIRWCWVDCGDNVLSSGEGDTLYISANVYDFANSDPDNLLNGRANITGGDQSFPTLTGAPDVCDVRTEKGSPERFVDFKNGGIMIVCADSIDARGDVNLNGLSNEIADAVMFTEYFVSGLGAFGTHIEGSIAATEINGDGIALSVADLVYLVRVIVGDALPLPKTVASVATSSAQGAVVSSDMELGAALFVFEGATSVELLAEGMELKTGIVDGNTHALVYSLNENTIAAGAVVSANANLVSVEAATTFGAMLSTESSVLPTEFAVYQNYPNPFNPKTNISMDLVDASPYTVSVYNVAGQLVEVISGEGEAGTVVVEWDAANFASGVYFYKVEVGSVSKTMKMVLLK